MSLSTMLAQRISDAVGTMWCAGLFAVIALVSLPAALATRSPIVIVGWVAQTFLQLVLLAVIQMGTRLGGERTDGTIREIHDLQVAEHAETRDMVRDLHAVVVAVHATVTGQDPS